jgi:imidazole glycerol-phosphate synthase subunit HisH
MSIVIIAYNAGNIHSVEYALRRLGVEPLVSGDPEVIRAADKVIFPGVGEASTTMAHLRHTGLDKVIKGLQQPALGICLGLQLMCAHSEEGSVDCLDIFPVAVKKFLPENNTLKVPHMGWNAITDLQSPLFNSIAAGSFVYFVHSFYAELSPYTIAKCDYVLPFSAALHRDNFYATQFHPEKSADVGAEILKDFLAL